MTASINSCEAQPTINDGLAGVTPKVSNTRQETSLTRKTPRELISRWMILLNWNLHHHLIVRHRTEITEFAAKQRRLWIFVSSTLTSVNLHDLDLLVVEYRIRLIRNKMPDCIAMVQTVLVTGISIWNCKGFGLLPKGRGAGPGPLCAELEGLDPIYTSE